MSFLDTMKRTAGYIPGFDQTMEAMGIYESDADRQKRLAKEAQARGEAQAQRLRDEYLGPLLQSGEQGIRGGYARGRQQVRDATGAQGRRVLQNASARGLHHSGATRGMTQQLGAQQRDQLTGLDTAEANALAQLLQMGAMMDTGWTASELEAQLIPLMMMMEQMRADAAQSAGQMGLVGQLTGGALSNPVLMKAGLNALGVPAV